MENIETGGERLSEQARALWAKTGTREAPNLWGALIVHLADTAQVARLLWRHWLATSTRDYICCQMGLDNNQAQTVLSWVACVHDIGKATPSFESKVPERAEAVREAGLLMGANAERLQHAYLGEILFQEWLVHHGVDEGLAESLAVLVGAHHGVNSSEDDLSRIRTRNKINCVGCLGNVAWSVVQDELLVWAFEQTGMQDQKAYLAHGNIPPAAQVLLIGLVIMADWIASNVDLFPLESHYDGWAHCQKRANSAWNQLHLPRPIRIESVPYDDEAMFHGRFPGLPNDAELHATQKMVMDSARQMDEPGLVIVEEQMGGGKTEAAAMAAEILLQKFGGSGVAFLLPTQATSNAMFARMQNWLQCFIAAQHLDYSQDIHLLHGKAALNQDFASLPLWKATWMGDEPTDGEPIVVNQWFSGAKRGLLAPFVVGTVDQLLMAALKTKHLHLRHLGLANKVVVIDEVHAYDAYMCEYLKCILKYLGSYHVPVILLSATLPPSRREELLKAYRGELRRRRSRRFSLPGPPRLESGRPAYPLVSLTSSNRSMSPSYHVITKPSDSRSIKLGYILDNLDDLVSELKIVLRDGGCACVIRNTVRRAQEAYEVLKAELDVEVLLIHSRFVATDRAANDGHISKLLGPDESSRPKAMVVVSTQVIEQSLDVDFDYMITDIAPIDLMIQRMGRLHRHRRGDEESRRPEPLQTARCAITGYNSREEDAPEFARGIDAIYQPAILMRTLAVLEPMIYGQQGLSLPDDIATLIESVYEQDVQIPDTWRDAYQQALLKEGEEMERKKQSANEWLLGNMPYLSLRGWMRARVNWQDETLGRASVRDTDETIEVAVVLQTARGIELLPWVARELEVDPFLGTGADVPDDAHARAVSLCSVCLPPAMSAPYVAGDVIGALENKARFPGWRESRWLYGVLPLVLDERGEAVIECDKKAFCVRYTKEVGLELIN